MENFCDNLKLLRKSKKIQQKDVAGHLGVALRTYQSYEYGEREPDIKTIKLLADYFDVSVDYLLGRVDTPNWR